MKEKTHRGLGAIYSLCIVLPIGIYWAILLKNAANAPYFDDYYDSIFPITTYLEAGNLKEKLNALFYSYYQHKFVYGRVVYFLYYQIAGDLNFKNLTLIGNISTLATFCILCSLVTPKARLIKPSIALILFNSYFYEGAFSAAGSLEQNMPIAFVIGSLKLLDEKKIAHTAFACLLCWLGAFTQSNAILVIPLGFLLIAHKTLCSKEKLISPRNTMWIINSIFCAAIFYSYQNIFTYKSNITDLFGKSDDSIIADFIRSLGSMPFNDIEIPPEATNISLALGLVHLTIASMLLIKAWKAYPTLCTIILFSLVSLLAASIVRVPVYDPIAFKSRIKIFTSVMLCAEIIIIANIFPSKKIFVFISIFSIIFNIHSHTKIIKNIITYKEGKEMQIVRWMKTGKVSNMDNFFSLPFESEILDNAYRHGVYKPSDISTIQKGKTLIRETENCPEEKSAKEIPNSPIATLEDSSRYVSMSGIYQENSKEEVIEILLCGSKNYNVTYEKDIKDKKSNNDHTELFLEKERFYPSAYNIYIKNKDNSLTKIAEKVNFSYQKTGGNEECHEKISLIFRNIYNHYCR